MAGVWLCAKGEAKAFGGHTTSGQTPVVPAKAMNLLERSISDPDETIRISFRPNEVLMKTEKAMVYSRLVEGRFPNYRQALPQKLPIKVPITVGPFMAAVRQAAIMTDEESKRVIFGFDKKKLRSGPRAPNRADRVSSCRWSSTARRSRSASIRSSCSTC